MHPACLAVRPPSATARSTGAVPFRLLLPGAAARVDPEAGGLEENPAELTRLLRLARAGDGRARDDLLPHVYASLRAIADGAMRRWDSSSTLQPTALVHEVFLRLIAGGEKNWESRAHFFALAATAMRHILTDHARRRGAEKRGGDWGRVSLTWTPGAEGAGSPADAALDAMALDEALTRLAATNPRQARIVELRFYAGLEVDEVARVLGVSPRTVDLDWRIARARLRQMLEGG